MHYLWYFPMITTIVTVFLLVLFCYNCVCANEDKFWGSMTPNKRNRDPFRRDTLTAPPVILPNQTSVSRSKYDFQQDQGNITIA